MDVSIVRNKVYLTMTYIRNCAIIPSSSFDRTISYLILFIEETKTKNKYKKKDQNQIKMHHPTLLKSFEKKIQKQRLEKEISELKGRLSRNNVDKKETTSTFFRAAKYGHEQFCKLIMDVIEDKNPKDPFGKTPLHWAARNGHKTICKMIMDEVEDKNPKDLFGKFT